MMKLKFARYGIVILITIGVFLISGCVQQGMPICPPSGFPQPPGCEGGAPVAKTMREDFGCWPPSCSFIPDEASQIMCNDFKAGKIIDYWPDRCSSFPTSQCVRLCESEKKLVHDIGEANWLAGIKDNVNWWKNPQTKVFVHGWYRKRLEILRPEANAWGGIALSKEQAPLSVEYPHYYNETFVAAVASFAGTQEFIDENGIDRGAWELSQIDASLHEGAARNLEGELVHDKYTPGIDRPGKTELFFNAYHPALKAKIVADMKGAIDRGADGLLVDGMRVTPTTYLAEHFNPYTQLKFRKYLKEELPPQRWQELAASADDFHYGAFLLAKGYTSESFGKAPENAPLGLEFRRFISELYVQAFKEVVDEIRAYAQSQGRQITITGNIGDLGNHALPAEEYLDYLTFEFGYVTQDAPYRSVVSRTKLADARQKTVVNIMWADSWPLLSKLPKETAYEVEKLATMESYATKSNKIFARPAYSYAGTDLETKSQAEMLKLAEDTSDIQAIMPAFDFMRKHKSYFADFTSTNAKVAIVYSVEEASRFFENDVEDQHHWDVVGVGDLLYRQGIDYDVVPPGSSISKYSVVVLPRTSVIPDSQADVLLSFTNEGGMLVLLNKPAGKLSKVTEGPYGKGAIKIMSPDDKPTIVATVEEKTGSISTSANLAVVSYNNGGEHIIHLFNLENAGTAEWATKQNVAVSIPFKESGHKVFYASLEKPELVELVHPVIPEIKTYGMLVLKK